MGSNGHYGVQVEHRELRRAGVEVAKSLNPPGPGIPPPPTHDGSIPVLLERVTRELAMLDEVVLVLADRLVPVLTPVTKDDESIAGPSTPDRTQLGASLRRTAEQIEVQRLRVGNLLARLEL